MAGISFEDVESLERALVGADYLPDRELSTAMFASSALELPLLLEGEAGVGKTEAAKALARGTGSRLIRLQCHEGIDVSQALYDWDYQRQLLAVRHAQDGVGAVADLYGEEFLIRRPLLEALRGEQPTVVLIDEIDRADDEFEAFLLELLSDFQVTIPELGTITAEVRPSVILTSNRTRELHDALKRRCLYAWIDYPAPEREAEIVQRLVPEASIQIVDRVCAAVARLRALDLYKQPGVGETVAWARALLALDGESLEETLFAVLKVHEDIERVRAERLLDGV